MTEAEWLATSNPTAMLEDTELTSDRKLRLFAVACCRRVWEFLRDARARRAVEVAEWYADGAATVEQLDDARDTAERGECAVDWELHIAQCTTRRAANAASCVLYASKLYADMVVSPSASNAEWDLADSAESAAQAILLREVFGNPFRPLTFSPSWRTNTAAALARTMHDSREFSAMPILADALQDAGCDNEDILSHCRGPGPHVRGCWVVDLVLGKE
jgi:hypothetical protein